MVLYRRRKERHMSANIYGFNDVCLLDYEEVKENEHDCKATAENASEKKNGKFFFILQLWEVK